MNLRRIYFLFVALLMTGLTALAQTLPQFSTEDAPHYYKVQFNKGAAFLSAPNATGYLQTASTTNDNSAWQLIGTKDNFKMKSKSGRWVNFSASRFTASTTTGTALKLVASSTSGCWEIQRVGQSMSMNQFGGAGAGKQLGEYTAGDVNNPLIFIDQTLTEPTFSTEGAETWYFVQFRRGGNVLADQGEGEAVRMATADPVDGQLWKLVGTKENFQLINKAGRYAEISTKGLTAAEAVVGGANATPLRTSATAFTPGFKLVETANGTYSPAWEISPNNKSGQGLNQWGGPNAGMSVGLYNLGDANNPLVFVTEDAMVYADFKSVGISGYVPEHDLTLWYNEPATTAKLYSGGQGYSNWMEYALPIGDGQFGASLFGGIQKDEIQFNEKTLWSGRSTDYTGGGSGYGIYQNFGSVYAEDLSGALGYSSDKAARDYYRQLDLTNATGKVSFKDKDGVTYTREYIASNPDRVVAARYSASEAGKISLRFTMKSGSVTATTSYANAEGTFSGKLETVSYNARFKVVPTGGTLTTTDEGIEVKGADEVLVILAGGTDFDAYSKSYVSNTAELASTIQARINDAAAKTWTDLYAAHVADYQKYFARVDFQLDGTKNTMPTDSLVDHYNSGNGADALMLERLYFAYGRYLEIASSRGVDLPSNLQGIWNNMANPAWNADIHSNINVQMNYWPAEPTNLSDMHLPFLNYIWNMAVNHTEWQGYAKNKAGMKRGWYTPTENNIFGGGTSFASTYVIANAWYCTHLWQHYRYTLDKDFLQKVFPAMLTATQFWIDRLKLASDGTYEAPNEWSPEHGPTQNGVAHAQQLVAELFDNTLAAIDVLGQEAAGISDDDYAKLKDRNAKLDRGLHTETYTGAWGATWNGLKKGETILREWKYSPYSVTNDKNHRHMSHLMCMYPFSQVYPGTGLFKAAVNSMILRGDGATGWSMGWKINLWARALDGNHARTILNNALKHANGGSGVFYNLFDSHAPFQIDGNFGACAGIAEMIMQSNSDTIRILPALPTAWQTGHMKGLKAVGDFTVDIEWEKGLPKQVTITNNQGQPGIVSYHNIAAATYTVDGVAQEADPATPADVAHIPAKKGAVAVFDFSNYVTGIGHAATPTANGLDANVAGRTVTLTGATVTAVEVYDLAGRHLISTAKPVFTVGKGLGDVVLVKATATDGKTSQLKVALQ